LERSRKGWGVRGGGRVVGPRERDGGEGEKEREHTRRRTRQPHRRKLKRRYSPTKQAKDRATKLANLPDTVVKLQEEAQA
jgi:hypothetical protein